MSLSKYPNELDDSSSIPAAIDHVTHVEAIVYNRVRDALLAIETELGTQPSREFGTVRARIDALGSTINSVFDLIGDNPSGDFDSLKERLDDLDSKVESVLLRLSSLEEAAKIFIPLAINANVQTGVFTAIGGDEFDPSNFIVEGRQIVFVVRIHTSSAAIAAQIRLFNVTDNESVASTEFSSNSLAPVRNEVILNVPADLPNEQKTYEVQLRQSAANPAESVFCQKAELQLIFV